MLLIQSQVHPLFYYWQIPFGGLKRNPETTSQGPQNTWRERKEQRKKEVFNGLLNEIGLRGSLRRIKILLCLQSLDVKINCSAHNLGIFLFFKGATGPESYSQDSFRPFFRMKHVVKRILCLKDTYFHLLVAFSKVVHFVLLLLYTLPKYFRNPININGVFT